MTTQKITFSSSRRRKNFSIMSKKPKFDISEHPEFKAVPGFDGLYSVDSTGRVYSHRKKKLMKPDIHRFGYMRVELIKNGIHKSTGVHRLVALTFIPNPKNLPHINHRDENPSNNNVDNLEWCDQKYNSNYGTSKYRIAAKLRVGPKCKAVSQFLKDGTFVQDYFSIAEAVKQTGFSESGIISCCKGIYASCHGYVFKYKLPGFNED